MIKIKRNCGSIGNELIIMNNLGTINGEEIQSINVCGYEQGNIQDGFTSYKEAYNFIQNLKKFDKKEGIQDTYLLELETNTSCYGYYTIRKYKNRFIIKSERR